MYARHTCGVYGLARMGNKGGGHSPPWLLHAVSFINISRNCSSPFL